MSRVISTMSDIADSIDTFIRGVCVALVVSMFVIIIGEVFLRYFNIYGIMWYEEIVRLMTVGMGFLGSTVAFKQGAHTMLELLNRRISPKAARWVSLGANLIILAFLVVLIIFGMKLCILIPTRTPVLRLKLSYALFAVPISAFLMIFYMSIQLAETWIVKRVALKDGDRLEEQR
jgi:TRAP-type C4-dicarboxylate transport system permease small subunit